MSDRPDLLPAVTRVITHYQRVCEPCPSLKLQAARDAVVAWLIRGRTEEDLTRAADRFAAQCRASDTKRQACQRFYSDSGSYEAYAGDAPVGVPRQQARAPTPYKRPSYDPAAGEALARATNKNPGTKEG